MPSARFGPLARALALVALACSLFALGAYAASTSADAVIVRAREFLGGEVALNAVNSIRFSGTILMQNGTIGDIEIHVRKPMQQRITITIDNVREITALSDYDGWRKVENIRNPSAWEVTLLNAPQIRRLRANTVENIGFYRGVPALRPKVELVAEAIENDLAVAKVAFNYPGGIQFLRTFNAGTGELIRTELEDGGLLTESGQLVVQGVRFPRELVTKSRTGTSTVLFTSIQVNETFEDRLFDVPMLLPGGE